MMSKLKRRDFLNDRVGKNDHPSSRPSRVTYMAHGKGWVMVRHPGCIPFAVTEAAWLSFPIYQKPTDTGSVT